MTIARACQALLLLALPGCCFTSHSEVTESVVEMPPAPPPGYDVVMVCTRAELLLPESDSAHCGTHTAAIPTSELAVEVSLRTHDLARYAAGATLLVATGEGASRNEIARRVIAAPVVPPDAQPGSLTWTTRVLVEAPPAGWPPGVPVRFRILDGAGAALESVTVFSGPAIAPPAPRTIGRVEFCRAADFVGPPENPYCLGSAAITSIPGGEGMLHMSYSTADPAVLAHPLTATIERRHGDEWEEVVRRPFPGEARPTEVTTFVLNVDLTNETWRAPNTWRFRILGGEPESEIASGQIDVL